MSRHDLVSAQTSNVCITHLAALNAIAYIICVKQFVMSQDLHAVFKYDLLARAG